MRLVIETRRAGPRLPGLPSSTGRASGSRRPASGISASVLDSRRDHSSAVIANSSVVTLRRWMGLRALLVVVVSFTSRCLPSRDDANARARSTTHAVMSTSAVKSVIYHRSSSASSRSTLSTERRSSNTSRAKGNDTLCSHLRPTQFDHAGLPTWPRGEEGIHHGGVRCSRVPSPVPSPPRACLPPGLNRPRRKRSPSCRPRGRRARHRSRLSSCSRRPRLRSR